MTFTQIVFQLLEGMGRSISIFALTLLFSLPLGLVVMAGARNNWAPFKGLVRSDTNSAVKQLLQIRPLRVLTRFFISILRGTPLMLQLMVVYFGPFYIFHVDISLAYQFYAVIIAFSVNYAAYFAEIYRGGLESIPRGQWEAAQVLGYTRSQTFFKIILPQVIRVILPSITNEVITLIKDTSLAMVIAYAEMFTLAKRMVAAEGNILPYVAAAGFYYIFNLLVVWVMGSLEKKLDYNKGGSNSCL